MKQHPILKKISILVFLIFITNSCVDWDDNLEKPNEPVLVEVSPNDPNELGLSPQCASIPEQPETLSTLAINPNLPQTVDLSELMPPVRSQGRQGSCVSWATTYYLKSYLDKVQYGYDYSDYSTVMSPAFVFNQTKVDCLLGSCIENALYLLKTKGTTTWMQFPYNDQNCSLQPNQSQLTAALNHKISRSVKIDAETELNNQTYSRLEIIKNLLNQGTPVIMAISLDDSFKNTTPRNSENLYIYNSYNPSQNYGGCGHAMLIVGYDNSLNAFKVVNSWGSGWANEGYCWISYNFFKAVTDSQFESGLIGTYTAYN